MNNVKLKIFLTGEDFCQLYTLLVSLNCYLNLENNFIFSYIDCTVKLHSANVLFFCKSNFLQLKVGRYLYFALAKHIYLQYFLYYLNNLQ